MVDIVISVACYNNEQEIVVFARNLKKQTISDRIKLVVSCNACSDIDKFSADLKNEYPLSEVYNPKKNLGYLNGCLYGFQNQQKQKQQFQGHQQEALLNVWGL